MKNVNGTTHSLMNEKSCAVEGDLAHSPLPPPSQGGGKRPWGAELKHSLNVGHWLMSEKRCAVGGDLAYPPLPPLHKGGEKALAYRTEAFSEHRALVDD